MTPSAQTYLFLAYGVFWGVPLALLVIILLRLNRLAREVAALRQRLGDNGARHAGGQGPDLEDA